MFVVNIIDVLKTRDPPKFAISFTPALFQCLNRGFGIEAGGWYNCHRMSGRNPELPRPPRRMDWPAIFEQLTEAVPALPGLWLQQARSGDVESGIDLRGRSHDRAQYGLRFAWRLLEGMDKRLSTPTEELLFLKGRRFVIESGSTAPIRVEFRDNSRSGERSYLLRVGNGPSLAIRQTRGEPGIKCEKGIVPPFNPDQELKLARQVVGPLADLANKKVRLTAISYVPEDTDKSMEIRINRLPKKFRRSFME